LNSDGTISARLGTKALSVKDQQAMLPGIWYQVTVTFVTATDRSYGSVTLGTNIILSLNGVFPYVPFDPSDKVFIGKFSSSSVTMTDIRIYVPGAYLVTDLQSCSYPSVPSTCGVTFGAPNPDICFSCPESTYSKNLNCINGNILKLFHPYNPE